MGDGSQSQRCGEQSPYWIAKEISSRHIHEQEYSFWTSPQAGLAYVFIALSLLSRDLRILHGATLVILFQIMLLIRKWTRFVLANPMVLECAEISTGYLKLVLRHVGAFLDQEKYHPVRKITAAVVLHQRNLQFFVLKNYIQRRNRFMKRKFLDLHKNQRLTYSGEAKTPPR